MILSNQKSGTSASAFKHGSVMASGNGRVNEPPLQIYSGCAPSLSGRADVSGDNFSDVLKGNKRVCCVSKYKSKYNLNKFT